MATSQPDECFRFVIVGRNGSGKSSTGNTILGKRLFDTRCRMSSRDRFCKLKTNQRRGQNIEILDCPGLFDTKLSPRQMSMITVQAVAAMHPGLHAVLFVISVGRFTTEEYEIYKFMKTLFDDSISRYFIIVFTHGDMLERDEMTLDDLIGAEAPQNLQQVLRECNRRCVVFNNLADDPQPQVDGLLQMVRHMNTENGDLPYTCPRYAFIGQDMEEEVARRLREAGEGDLQPMHEHFAHRPLSDGPGQASETESTTRSVEDSTEDERSLQKNMQRLEQHMLEIKKAIVSYRGSNFNLYVEKCKNLYVSNEQSEQPHQ